MFILVDVVNLCFFVFAVIDVGLMDAPSVTIVIVQIGSLLAVFFAVLWIERNKISWVNKYQRGFHRVWVAFSSGLGIAVIIAWLVENLDVERLEDGEKWFFALLPAIVYIIVFAIGHSVFLVVWWIIRGFR